MNEFDRVLVAELRTVVEQLRKRQTLLAADAVSRAILRIEELSRGTR